MKKFKKITLAFNPFSSDLVSGLLWEFDIAGILESQRNLTVFASAESSFDADSVSLMMEKLKSESLIESFSVEQQIIEDKDWNTAWEKNLNIIHMTDKIVIRPSFKKYLPNKNETEILIDPKMSFGTGEHETTRLVIRLLEKYCRHGQSVLDVGSGTGILSITAAKLGAQTVIGIDNDEWCLLNGNENIKQNDVDDLVQIRLCEINEVPEKNFDMIIANINKNILLEIAKQICDKAAPGSTVILSGLLINDKPDIVNAYEKYGVKLTDEKSEGEWIAIVFKK